MLFMLVQGPDMNDEHCIIRIEYVNNLEQPISTPSAHDQQLVVADLLGKGGPGLPDDPFRFFRVHSMLKDMVSVPVDPSKLHGPPRLSRRLWNPQGRLQALVDLSHKIGGQIANDSPHVLLDNRMEPLAAYGRVI
jgi:hypothetical protein